MGLTYPQLYIKNEMSGNSVARRYLYREKTNVFAYYVVKTLLLFFHVEFMNWCDIHNGLSLLQFRQTRLNLMDFAKFIELCHNNEKFLKLVHQLQQLLYSSKESGNSSILTTMRMSVCELEE